MPSMSAGSRPASAMARFPAPPPMAVGVRGFAELSRVLVYAVSPMPTIATSPAMSSSSAAWPQSDIGGTVFDAGLWESGPPRRHGPADAHASRRRRDRPHDRLPDRRPPPLLRVPEAAAARQGVARRF